MENLMAGGSTDSGNFTSPCLASNQRRLDLSTIAYDLGGRKLLYVLTQGLGLPSLRTPRHHMAFTPGRTERHGINMMIDEVALEERGVDFCRKNQVGGLCRRHSPSVTLTLDSYKSEIKLAEDIKKGDVHLAKEMTVAALSCFGDSGTYRF
ncbi:hypothetical protein B0H13DRAFT_2302277 [Mycena leptocephala]|nr:hypothetical protein B0H13DRAFT_2302277 [Mycena leptocephala]